MVRQSRSSFRLIGRTQGRWGPTARPHAPPGCRRTRRLDLSPGVRIGRTVVLVPRVGLVAERSKTRAGVRVLHLPDWLVDVLVARRDCVSLVGEALAGPAFASTAAAPALNLLPGATARSSRSKRT